MKGAGMTRTRTIRSLAPAICLVLALVLPAGSSGQSPGAPMGEGRDERIAPPDPQFVALERLRREASGPTNVHWVNGIPRAVDTSVLVPGRNSVERATAFLMRHKELYGQFMTDPFRQVSFDPNRLPDPDPSERLSDFRRELEGYQGKPTSSPDLGLAVRGTSGPDDNVVAFAQTYKGLPIFGADLLVFVDKRRVEGSVGGLLSISTWRASVRSSMPMRRPRLPAGPSASAMPTRRLPLPARTSRSLTPV